MTTTLHRFHWEPHPHVTGVWLGGNAPLRAIFFGMNAETGEFLLRDGDVGKDSVRYLQPGTHSHDPPPPDTADDGRGPTPGDPEP